MTEPDRTEAPIVIVGAGLAGLRCARELSAHGRNVRLLEASDGVGGRVRTDRVDGFLLDRGFQVILTAYPRLSAAVDLGSLDLRRFEPGALVLRGGRRHRLVDPFRRPSRVLRAVFGGLGGLLDKARVGRLRLDCLRGESDALFARSDRSTLEALRARGFGSELLDGFFRPFLGGILLDRDLGTSSRFFEFVFRMLSLGDTAVPARGMQALPEAMAAELPDGCLSTGVAVRAVEDGGRALVLEDGTRLDAAATVLAVDGPSAVELCPQESRDELGPPPDSRSVTCLYFDAPTSPAGRHLVSVTVLGHRDEPDLERRVRAELTSWFGAEVADWRHLRSYAIHHAQPAQPPGTIEPLEREPRLAEHLFVCGDHRVHASLEGAVRSGERAAAAVLASLPATS